MGGRGVTALGLVGAPVGALGWVGGGARCAACKTRPAALPCLERWAGRRAALAEAC